MRREVRRSKIAWWRFWAVEGSFNPQRLQWTGWLVARLGSLDAKERNPRVVAEILAAEETAANTHPYLVGLVFGVRQGLEERGEWEQAARLSGVLARVLGGIGDRLFWSGVVPTVVLGLILLGLSTGDPWGGLAVWGFFVTALAWMRWRLYQEGLRRGDEVLSLLEDPRVQRWAERFRRSATILTGSLVGAVLWRSYDPLTGAAFVAPAAVAAAGVGTLAAWRGWGPERWLVGVISTVWVVSALSHFFVWGD